MLVPLVMVGCGPAMTPTREPQESDGTTIDTSVGLEDSDSEPVELVGNGHDTDGVRAAGIGTR